MGNHTGFEPSDFEENLRQSFAVEQMLLGSGSNLGVGILRTWNVKEWNQTKVVIGKEAAFILHRIELYLVIFVGAVFILLSVFRSDYGVVLFLS